MPALRAPPRHPSINLSAGKEDCPRCGGRYLNPVERRCIACGADFTEQGLVEFRARPTLHALRS